MNADVLEKQRKVTEALISQIEECLRVRLLRKQYSNLHHPIPTLLPRIPPQFSIHSVSSSTNENFKAITDSPIKPEEQIDIPMDKESFHTSANATNFKPIKKSNSRFEDDSSVHRGMTSHFREAIDAHTRVNWRLLQQLHFQDTPDSISKRQKETPSVFSPFSSLHGTQPLSPTRSMASSSNSATVERTAHTNPRLCENGNALADSTRSPFTWVNTSTKERPTSSNSKSIDKKVPSHHRQHFNYSMAIDRSRSHRPTERLSERQLSSHIALQRRLEYNPHASVTRACSTRKTYDIDDDTENRKRRTASIPKNRFEAVEATKTKSTRNKPLDDPEIQLRTTQRKPDMITYSTNLQRQNPQFVGAGNNIRRFNTTSPPCSRTRSERSRTNRKEPLLESANSGKYSATSVETISQKLDRLAKHVVHLRRLLERDSSQTGYVSPGDDIYVDEEVGAINKGRSTGMHPTIANSLRNIRILEANVQGVAI